MDLTPSSTALSKKGKPRARPAFPRVPLFGAIGLLLFCVVAIIFGQVTEIGTLRVASGQPLEIRDLVFADGADGSVLISDAFTGETIKTILPGEGGFIRGSLRGLGRLRAMQEVAQEQPYRLILWDDGSLTLSDTGTGDRIVLNAFGPTNANAFKALL